MLTFLTPLVSSIDDPDTSGLQAVRSASQEMETVQKQYFRNETAVILLWENVLLVRMSNAFKTPEKCEYQK